MKKLNLGCGLDVREGWINVDFVNNEGVDMVWDLNQFPYPFKDSEFEMVLMSGVIEHLDNPKKVIEEVWRISRAGANVFINAPHFSCWQAWGDIEHKRPFNHTSLFAFSSKLSHRGSDSLINKRKEIFDMQIKIKMGKFYRVFGIEFLINLNNAARGFYERNFAYIFPAQNIEFKLIVIKKSV